MQNKTHSVSGFSSSAEPAVSHTGTSGRDAMQREINEAEAAEGEKGKLSVRFGSETITFSIFQTCFRRSSRLISVDSSLETFALGERTTHYAIVSPSQSFRALFS